MINFKAKLLAIASVVRTDLETVLSLTLALG